MAKTSLLDRAVARQLQAQVIRRLAVRQERWWLVVLVGVATAVGLALRIANIESRPLWIDEFGQIKAASQPVGEMLYTVRTMAAAAPADFFGTRLALAVAPNYQYAARLWPLAVGVASVPAMYLAVRVWSGPIAGVLAAWLLAILPFHVYYSTEARPYALAMLCTIGLLWAVRGGHRAAIAVATWIGGLTYYPIALVALPLAVSMTRRRDWCSLSAAALGGLGVLPWLVYAAGRSGGVTWSAAVPSLFPATVTDINGLLSVSGPLVLLAAAAGAWRHHRESDWLALSFTAIITIPLTWGLAEMTHYYWAPRHVAPLLPILLVLASGAMHPGVRSWTATDAERSAIA